MNPYVGLRPFEEQESLFFFGRNDQKLELLDRLHKNHFVAVVGSSGCGKSSLLRAGLIPALKAGFLVADSDQWVVTIIKPGQSPLYRLAEGLLRSLDLQCSNEQVNQFCNDLRENATEAILKKIHEYYPSSKLNHFLLVDQFEELFRLTMNKNDTGKMEEAVEFVNIILELSKQTVLPFYVVITMRSDFIGDCSRFFGLPEALNQSLYLVPRLSRVQMRTVIEGPAKLMGGVIDPALVSHLLNEVGKVEDELPLLQHALMRMWNFEETVDRSGVINFEDYQKIGGIEQALSQHADEAIKDMEDQEVALTREIFQSLTIIDENGRKVRRPVSLRHLMNLTGESKEKILRIIEQFTKDDRSFLFANKSGEEDNIVFDISHESLIRRWTKLCQWVDEEGELVMKYRKWLNYAKWYNQRPKKEKKNYLLSGPELQEALIWSRNKKVFETWAIQYEPLYTDCKNYITLSKKNADDKARIRRRIRTSAYVLISIVLLFAGYYLFDLLYKKSLTKNEEVVSVIEKKNDSIIQIRKTLSDFGYSNEKMDQLKNINMDEFDLINRNIMQLSASIDTSINISYFAKLSDQDKAVMALKELGYKVELLSTRKEMADSETNAIWVGSDVSRKIDDVRLVALYLFRAGLNIRSIKLFEQAEKKEKRNLIQIGSSANSIRYPGWTLQQILDMEQIDRDGRPSSARIKRDNTKQ